MSSLAYIGVDVGTSAVRACAVDAAGAGLAEARAPLPDGPAREQDPETWWRALTQALDVLFTQCSGSAIQTLALAGTSGSVLLCTADGDPLSPALMYHDDRAAGQADRLRGIAPADSPVQAPTSGLAKALWLHARYGGGAGLRILHQADWLAGRLCGRYDCSDENNALKLGYDPVARRWPDWLAATGLPLDALPRVQPPGMPLAPLRPELARRWGVSAQARVLAGTTDSTAAFLAAGARLPGEGVTVLGSTLVLKILSERPVHAPAHGIYSHRIGDLWLAGGASNSGGAVLARWFTPEQLQAYSARIDPGRASALGYYPLLAPGERFPTADPELAPKLTPRPLDDAEFLQGLLEGMAGIEARGYALLHELGAPALRSVRSTGGGAINTAWSAIRARHLGVPLLPAAQTEAMYGAARIARGDLAAFHAS